MAFDRLGPQVGPPRTYLPSEPSRELQPIAQPQIVQCHAGLTRCRGLHAHMQPTALCVFKLTAQRRGSSMRRQVYKHDPCKPSISSFFYVLTSADLYSPSFDIGQLRFRARSVHSSPAGRAGGSECSPSPPNPALIPMRRCAARRPPSARTKTSWQLPLVSTRAAEVAECS